MTDDDLFAAICTHPEDDTPRLVYADWLDEHGRAEEAEFIRVQCRLSVASPADADALELQEREDELRLWLRACSRMPAARHVAGMEINSHAWWDYCSRGFPRFVEYDGDPTHGIRPIREMAAALPEVLRQTPTRWLVVRRISLEQLAELVRQPVMQHLTELTLQPNILGEGEDDEAVRLLATSLHLRNLRGLSMTVPAGEEGCAAMAASANFARLRWFSPESTRLTAAAIQSLYSAEWFRGLRSLTLDDSLGDDAFEALITRGSLPELHTLDLANNSFPMPLWEAFARTRSLPRLAKLVLRDTDMSQGRLSALARANGFELRELDLTRSAIHNVGAKALTRAPWAGSLRRLVLRENLLSSLGAATLATCRRFGELRHLNLSYNELNPDVIRAITTNPALQGLQRLELDASRRGQANGSVAELEPHLRKLDLRALRYLDLSGLPLGLPGARALAENPAFRTLTRLILSDCGLGPAAVQELAQSPHLAQVLKLDLSNNGLGAGLKPLADPAVFPRLVDCNINANDAPKALATKIRRRPRFAE